MDFRNLNGLASTYFMQFCNGKVGGISSEGVVLLGSICKEIRQ